MAFKLPKLNIKGTSIKEGLQRKYGTGEYARGGKKFEQRMKPGESKFKYDIRMREQARKTPSMKPSSKSVFPDPSTEISPTGGPSYGYQMQERNPGDLRVQSRRSTSILPSAPGDPFEYRFDEEGKILIADTRKDKDKFGMMKWDTPKPHQEKAIRERYTGSETGSLEEWRGHDTSGFDYSYQVDPSAGFGREGVEEGTWSATDFERRSYLPYDLAQKKYNPKYKGSKK